MRTTRDERTSDELLRRWQRDGDAEALDDLLRTEIQELKKRLRRQGRRSGLVRSDASVSDVAQEAALAVVRTEGAVFTESRSFRAYLWRAAWRLLVRRLRRRREYVPLDSALPAPASSDAFSRLDQDETARAVRFALHLLGEDERGLLEMSFFQGRTNKQIAEALGITAEAARMRLARARRKMAGKLGAWRSLVERDEGAES